MFDARLRPLIDPPLNALGRRLARVGISANALTLAGMIMALTTGWVLAQGWSAVGLALILANRLFDGLDGAVARATRLTDFGGYLDIVGDFVFYVAVPLGFALALPANALPAAVLIASFTLTGISFLAFAAMAAKRGIETEAHGRKSFFYSTGLAEGAETIGVFVMMCLWPQHFALIAWIYSAICIVTLIQRSIFACQLFSRGA